VEKILRRSHRNCIQPDAAEAGGLETGGDAAEAAAEDEDEGEAEIDRSVSEGADAAVAR
jgi:hypothetical protein